MAKSKTSGKKKNKGGLVPRISPVEYMREKARTLPLGKCYLCSDPSRQGRYVAIVTRVRPSGNLVTGLFKIDTLCFGVTDAFCLVNLTPSEWDNAVKELIDDIELREAPYAEIHNMIYGAIEFAEEAEIDPAPSFDIAENILEEDTDDIPLISYDYGRDGKHFVSVDHYDSNAALVIAELRERLGDRFAYEITDPDAPLSAIIASGPRLPSEPFAYDYPDYPAEPEVRHRFIADAFLSPDNLFTLPEDVRRQIMALPPDEAAADMASIILYVIGATYRDIEAGDDAIPHGAIIHSLIFLSELGSAKALPAVRELLRQSFDFTDAHIGDFSSDLLPAALRASAGDRPEAIADMLDIPGLDSSNRFYIFKALALMAVDADSSLREKIIEILRRHLDRIAADLPATHACDAVYAGVIMTMLEELGATELLPEIRKVFDSGCVDLSIAGSYEDVAAEMENANGGRIYELSSHSTDEYYEMLDRSRLIDEQLI